MATQEQINKATENVTYTAIDSISRPIMIREGLWLHRDLYIERMDRVNGTFPDDPLFMRWVVIGTQMFMKNGQVIYKMYHDASDSLHDAIQEIDEVLDDN
jgi:hypothetical protein